jgi:hypothetical protein
MEQRRKTLYRETIDKLALPDNWMEFQGMVSSLNRDQQRRGSKTGLKAENLDEYAKYFQSTFAKPAFSTHSSTMEAWYEIREDPAITLDCIKKAIKDIPAYKPPGMDKIVGKVWKLADKRMPEVLRGLFTLCTRLGKIPS